MNDEELPPLKNGDRLARLATRICHQHHRDKPWPRPGLFFTYRRAASVGCRAETADMPPSGGIFKIGDKARVPASWICHHLLGVEPTAVKMVTRAADRGAATLPGHRARHAPRSGCAMRFTICRGHGCPLSDWVDTSRSNRPGNFPTSHTSCTDGIHRTITASAQA